MILISNTHYDVFCPHLVVKKSQRPNQPDLNGYTPLHTALYHQCVFFPFVFESK